MDDPARSPVRLTVLGCGDAFGSGGRLQTCFHLRTPGHVFLVDCGTTVCIGMKRFAIDAATVDAILISHFHADHFAGIPFLLLEARIAGRSAPLTIAGPPGVEERIMAAARVLFPGSKPELPFDLRFVDYRADGPTPVGPLEVAAFPVIHSPETLPHALRIGLDHHVIAFSGDTEWTPALTTVARGADLLICECSGFDAPLPIHLDYATLLLQRPGLDCRRLLLTHMGPGVLANAGSVAEALAATPADDGMVIDLG